MKTIIMKTTSFILALVLSTSLGKAQNAPQVSYFPLQNVKLLDSPFLQAQQTDLHYILALDPDRLLAPFLREAGLQPKAPATPIGKIPDWTGISADIIYPHFP